MSRMLKFGQAINEAISLMMEKAPSVYIIGAGVPDPKGIFGSTLGLAQKFGSKRVMDMPVSENAVTGIVIGSALVGMRPIMTHQRMDFTLLAMDQLVNNAAKWHYMFGGQLKVPIVVRMLIGRGWGQGAQHSQNLQALYMHIPGLKVVVPTTPYDAKGLLISSIQDNNPVIFVEHRWLYNNVGEVPEGIYSVPLGKARVARSGKDITIAATSYMNIEALKAAQHLEKAGVEIELIDVRTLKPMDEVAIIQSVQKTGRLIAVDSAWATGGFAREIIARVSEKAFASLKSAPMRLSLPDIPSPTSRELVRYYYPRAITIVRAVKEMLGIGLTEEDRKFEEMENALPTDAPDLEFTGPF